MDQQVGDYYLIDDNEDYIVFNLSSLNMYRLHKNCKNDIKVLLDRIDSKVIQKRLEPSDIPSIEKKLKTLVICASETCNLACEYCFANKGTYHNNKEDRIIKFEEYKRLFENVLETFSEGIEAINFFGGEPLLGYSHIQRAVVWLKKYCEQRNIPIPVFSLITNGTIMSKEICDFLNENNVYLTISLDVNKEIHDRNRKFINGCGSYDLIKDNFKLIQEIPNRRFLVTCESTIGWEYLKHYKKGTIEKYFEGFYKLGIDSVVTFIVDSDCEVTEQMVEKIKVFYVDLVDYTFDLIMNHSDTRKVPPFILDQIVHIIKKQRKKECRVGKTTLFYTIGGDLYPCQMFYQAGKKYLGNLYEGKYCSSMNGLDKVKRTEIEDCQNCIAKNVCQEWCEGSSLLFNGNGRTTIKTRCILQKTITRQIILNLNRIYTERAKKDKFVQNMLNLTKEFSYQKLIHTADN